MKKRILMLLTAATMLVVMLAMSAAPAFATHNPVQRPFDTITVECDFQTGHGTFTQILPEAAEHGARTSNVQVNLHTGSNCRIVGD
jgi:ABC-type sugar transport system substrate-binding protein